MMVKQTHNIDICDITTIRVRCCKCNTIVEVSVDQLADTFTQSECLRCGEKFPQQVNTSVFQQIDSAAKRLRNLKDHLRIELVMDEDS